MATQKKTTKTSSTGKKQTKTVESTKKKKTGMNLGLMNDIRYGRSLSLEFFRRNAWLLMLFVVAVIALMGLRYKTKTQMEEIKRLNSELQQAQSSMLQEKAAYMSLIREAEMKKLVKDHGLDLEFQEYPPYELSVKN